ncbi:hypothetical protein PLICRDRAFT_43678 [Plicaturopsis crispa FD-325 SS-3]|nr:hypothetical protein PLICRDRAFT_43678 [Plicaturopsis crispa FD-325 SS-3]
MVSGSTTFLFAAFVLAAVLVVRARSRPALRYPPGPKPVPVLGNVRDLTAKGLWLEATKWADQFGSVVYLHVFGQPLIFLNTPKAAYDLLEKRGNVYSDKPRLIMAGELCGCDNMVAFTPYSDQSRRQRKLMMRALGTAAVRTYEPLIAVQTSALLKRLVAFPSSQNSARGKGMGWVDQVRQYAGSLTLHVVYGHNVTSSTDPFLTLAEECVDILSNGIAGGGGIWPVDVFQFLKHIPTSFPGAGFKRKAIFWKSRMEQFVEAPYAEVKKSVESGKAIPSFVSTLLDFDKEQSSKTVQDAEQEFDIKWTANSMYSASIDTTMTVIAHFLLAMTLHPEVLARAQAELDSVLVENGVARLPTFEDRKNLPYVDAIMSECLRWGVPVPLSLPHRVMEDDVYDDMFIPKGSLVFANVWAMVRDESLYPDAHSFKPERFLEEIDAATERRRDPRAYVFGFGRRRCPGFHLIESSAWLLMASMLATLHIGKAVDERGEVVEPEIKFENSVFRTPNPFVCDIRPRSEEALRVIQQQELEGDSISAR